MEPYSNFLPAVSEALTRHFPPPLPSHNLSNAEIFQQTLRLLPQIGLPHEPNSLSQTYIWWGCNSSHLGSTPKKGMEKNVTVEHNPGSLLLSDQVESAPFLELSVPRLSREGCQEHLDTWAELVALVVLIVPWWAFFSSQQLLSSHCDKYLYTCAKSAQGVAFVNRNFSSIRITEMHQGHVH